MATTTAQQAQNIIDDKTLVEEELWDELENEEIPADIREARLAAFKKQTQDYAMMRDKQHGSFTELTDEKAFLELTTTVDRCVVHFYHADFRRCAIIDQHLEVLAKKYFETKFAKLNVDVAKFLVEKLKIRILPAVYCFKKGIVVDRVIGFEELGSSDTFPTEVLESRLGKSGVIDVPEDQDISKKTIFGARSVGKNRDDDSSDDDY
ncbi:phosducin-like protein 3 [Haliotis asinina]|uniref:phosducin-like protein 3 n=1 Tax=Haliotis asinina TaxID=109174 RepID=UPI003531E183